MAHTHTCLYCHCVFSTRDRRPDMPPATMPQIFAYMGGIIQKLKGLPARIGGTLDHVHILYGFRPETSIADVVRTIKCNTSRWIHETFPDLRGFAWQEGYGAFTVSRSNVEAVARYIASQERHHKRMTFQEELLAFFKKHDVDYDPRHVWD